MAGDWIKMRIDLQSHPKVVRILSATKSDKFRAIGGLHAVWSVFDTHSVDGALYGYTPETLDHIIGWQGFSQAMIAVGWMEFDGVETLVLPEFDEHNGKSAKRRAEDQKRKRNDRNCPQPVRNLSADEQDENQDEKRTREEKRRDKYIPPISPELLKDFLQVRKAKRAGTLTETAFKGIIREAGIAGISTEDAVRICCERNWVSFKANWDWQSVSLGSERKRELSL
jgi:hypothetical protein